MRTTGIQTSQASQAERPARISGTGGGSIKLEMTPSSATSSRPPTRSTLDGNEIRDQVCDILNEVFAQTLETMQEMGFIWEVDRALGKAIMSEFVQLQLIVGDGLNTSL